MTAFRMATLLVACLTTAMAAEPPAAPPAEPPAVSPVEAAIPDTLKNLPPPTIMDFSAGIHMAVSAATDEAQAHVVQGMNHLIGGWEFEASRHFAAAMHEDPDCMLAHWGMVMCLLNPSPETQKAKIAATDRLLALVDQGNATELELGYAYGLIKYLQDGPVDAANAFRKVADNFPNDLQARIFAALFSRGGYDAAGEPTPDQIASEKSIEELIAKYPDNSAPLHALLTVRAESANLSNSLELARKLARMKPAYPPVIHLLGHYEWRCGNHAEAATAFEKAATLYQQWMTDNKVGLPDCPEWIKAECYRIVAIVSQGQFDPAYDAAIKIASTPIPAKRPASPGARCLMWDAMSLPARILLYRSSRGVADKASKSLPKPADLQPYQKQSLAYWWIDGLRLALEAQRLIDADKIEDAKNVVAALTQHGEMMCKSQNLASEMGEKSHWLRGFHGLEVLASDIRGRLAMAGTAEKRETAYNWFAAAIECQRPAPMFYPPMILSPMASRLGNYYLATKKPEDAIEAYQKALLAFPNDNQSLVGLKAAFEVAGKSNEALEIEQKIEELHQNH